MTIQIDNNIIRNYIWGEDAHVHDQELIEIGNLRLKKSFYERAEREAENYLQIYNSEKARWVPHFKSNMNNNIL